MNEFDTERKTTKTRLSNIIVARNRDEECLRLASKLAWLIKEIDEGGAGATIPLCGLIRPQH